MIKENKIAEVTESSSDSFFAQCYELYGAPDFGSVVKIEDGVTTTYAVCLQVRTMGLDPSRRPAARGYNAASREEVMRQNPQLSQLLMTEFKAQIIAHSQGGSFKSFLPPQSPKIHDFVYKATPAECKELGNNLDFMRGLIYGSLDVNNDEAVAALLRFLADTQDNRSVFLRRAGHEAAALILNDAARLKFFLRRLEC